MQSSPRKNKLLLASLRIYPVIGSQLTVTPHDEYRSTILVTPQMVFISAPSPEDIVVEDADPTIREAAITTDEPPGHWPPICQRIKRWQFWVFDVLPVLLALPVAA